MMKKGYFLKLCMPLLMTILLTISGQGAEPKSLSMEASIRQVGPGQLDLEVKLTNISSKSISLHRSELPWEFRYSLLIVVARSRPGGRVLEEELPVVDPRNGLEKVELKPGETLSGRISLNKRFPKLSEEIRTRSLIVFWAYQVTPIGGSQAEQLGGWVFVQKLGQ